MLWDDTIGWSEKDTNMDNQEIIDYPGPKQEYKVLVRCFSFNHSKYIEDALNGFAMQQTNFPFVCLVMDDASTDGEQDVIKAWMERECDMNKAETIDIPTSVVIIVPHKTNESCTFAFYLLKQNLYGTGDKKMNHVYPWREKSEYEALCEGDDYWIDPLKLQKQVDFLEENIDYGIVHTNYQRLRQITGKIHKSQVNIPSIESFDSLLKSNTIGTLTVCFRRDLLSCIDNSYHTENFKMGDYPLWLEMSRLSKIKYLHDITSVYRELENSASHSTNIQKRLLFLLNAVSIKKYFANKYNSQNSLRYISKEYNYLSALLAATEHKYISACKLYVASCQYSPTNFLRLIYYMLK